VSNTVRPPPAKRFALEIQQLAQDLIIAEDDPYFFLQIGEYVPKSHRKADGEPIQGGDVASFVASLVPTYLKFDTQGRVIRMDTFSKVRCSVPPALLCQPPYR
jgi:DNA-binding transcriptional MocR family regulator